MNMKESRTSQRYEETGAEVGEVFIGRFPSLESPKALK
jgi:hypothetical protein